MNVVNGDKKIPHGETTPKFGRFGPNDLEFTTMSNRFYDKHGKLRVIMLDRQQELDEMPFNMPSLEAAERNSPPALIPTTTPKETK